MTKEHQRIALAKWAGWTNIVTSILSGILGKNPDGSLYEPLPNYPESLDACHSIEVKLTDAQHALFRAFLFKTDAGAFSRENVSATSEQRCEALVKALGLWESSDTEKGKL